MELKFLECFSKANYAAISMRPYEQHIAFCHRRELENCCMRNRSRCGAADRCVRHGDRQLVAGISAGGQECHQERGGELCYIPVWSKLPPQ
jgi:hypothetical protein